MTALWKQLQGCVKTPRPAGWPHDTIVLFPPLDDAQTALRTLVAALERSLTIECFTYCDKDLHTVVGGKAATVGFAFAATFDQSQYEQVPSMKALVDELPAAAVAVGRSEHGEIVHRKVIVGDHLYVVGGSTNLTVSGERFEDNELVIRRDPVVAGVYEQILAANHQRIRAAVAASSTASSSGAA